MLVNEGSVNLEGKGVTLDVRVPVTEESERAKRDGKDPVLEAGLVALRAEAERRTAERLAGTTWPWTASFDAATRRVGIENPGAYTLAPPLTAARSPVLDAPGHLERVHVEGQAGDRLGLAALQGRAAPRDPS